MMSEQEIEARADKALRKLEEWQEANTTVCGFLTIYPPAGQHEATHPYVGPSKRFTRSELAAEWWSAEVTIREIRVQSALNPYHREDEWKLKHQRRNTLHRFATTPSYDEVPA